MLLSELDPALFRRRYWQQKPLLLRQALPGFRDPLSPEELAGLACEAEAEARLVFTRSQGWTLKQGPFRERDFTSLPARNWTLLVQAVDQWVPEVKELLTSVAFIPGWRVDDVMISYATPGGGVGPHFDLYDVFLVQGQGSRIWKTGQHCDESDLLRDGSGLKLLKDFRTEHEWRLEPGDVLYVPPGIAHWGVSCDESLCYSIGFRAPSVGEMLLGFGAAQHEQLPASRRYRDPPWQGLPLPGEIDAAALRQVQHLLLSVLKDKAALAEWFGCQMTEPKYPELIVPADTLPSLDEKGLMLLANPCSRFAWQRHDDELLVFADGHCCRQPWSASLQALAVRLAAPNACVPVARWLRSRHGRMLLEHLLAQGSLLPESAL